MRIHRLLTLALIGAAFVATAPATAAADDLEGQRERFRQAWADAARGQVDDLDQAIEALGDYPLVPYLEFERHRQRIDAVDETEMERFLARYRDWSFADILETRWLRSLGRRDRDAALLRHAGESGDEEVRCYVARARVRTGATDGLADEVRRLWLHGRSRPEACDTAFTWWRRQGHPDADDAWTRFGLAVAAGEYQLAGYLKRYLDDVDRRWADHWLTLARRPTHGLSEAARWRDHGRSRQLVAWTLERLAASDWQRADSHWQRLRGRYDWADGVRDSIDRRIALYRAVALDEEAIAAIDALPDGVVDEQLLQWRLRAALAHGRWEAVLESVRALPALAQADSRWRYWRARALAELQRPEAGLAYATLATEADYYGFLAAARLNVPYAICPRDLIADGALQRRLMRDAEFVRALELKHVGLAAHARRTWQRVMSRLSRAEQRQAALLAAGIGWHDRAALTLGGAGAMNAYRWRFPVAHRGLVEEHARRHDLDPALIYGLMRAESAMQADAVSSAGARGLLQLMPGTASEVARRNGLRYAGPASLADPEINIALGVARLAELSARYDGDWTRIAAAYNAGTRPVERWLESRPRGDPDIWLETLPYYETRDYVPRVLAFATVYEWQLQRPPRVLAAHVAGDGSETREFACPDADPQVAAGP